MDHIIGWTFTSRSRWIASPVKKMIRPTKNSNSALAVPLAYVTEYEISGTTRKNARSKIERTTTSGTSTMRLRSDRSSRNSTPTAANIFKSVVLRPRLEVTLGSRLRSRAGDTSTVESTNTYEGELSMA